MAKTIGSVFGKNGDIRSYKEDSSWVLPSTMIGVEIELERFTKWPIFNGPAYWEKKEDGSLRDIDGFAPAEYVFSVPLCGWDLTKALTIFENAIKKLSFPPCCSPRTSTHVHLDVRELTIDKILNLLVFYTIVERPLYKFCGMGREENNFCLPFYKAGFNTFDNLYGSDLLREDVDRLANITASHNRYNGLNLCSLRKFGTLEFRHLPGTFDMKLLRTWINIIMCLKKAAIEYTDNISILPTTFSEAGMSVKVKEMFGTYYDSIYYPELEYDVLQGVRLAQDIIHRRASQQTELEILSNVKEVKESVLYNSIRKEFKLPKSKNIASTTATNINIGEPEVEPFHILDAVEQNQAEMRAAAGYMWRRAIENNPPEAEARVNKVLVDTNVMRPEVGGRWPARRIANAHVHSVNDSARGHFWEIIVENDEHDLYNYELTPDGNLYYLDRGL